MENQNKIVLPKNCRKTLEKQGIKSYSEEESRNFEALFQKKTAYSESKSFEIEVLLDSFYLGLKFDSFLCQQKNFSIILNPPL